MTADAISLVRTAQRPVCQFRRWSNASSDYVADWVPLDQAVAASITHNIGAKPNEASILFDSLRWHETYDLYPGDRVRILTAGLVVLFEGFITSSRCGFSGGGISGGGFERNTCLCLDYRWLLNSTSPVYGQIARSIDDYTDYGTPSQAAIANKATFLSGRRCVFNEEGKPNRDPVLLTLSSHSSYPGAAQDMPIFAPPAHKASPAGTDSQYWTARQMIEYVLSPYYNQYWTYFSIPDPLLITGIDHADFGTILSGVRVEGLGLTDAVAKILSALGWSMRQYDSLLGPSLEFFKPGRAVGDTRSASAPTILHELHAPAVGESLAVAVAAGKKLIAKGEMISDIAAVINNPLGLGAPDKVEITAELVPAWLDSDFTPTEAAGYPNLFKTEAELAEMSDPDSLAYYTYYHTRGADFLRDVGRKWALNESGKYTGGDYDRGQPFDFSTVVDSAIVLDTDSRRLWGLYARKLLPCLTFDKDNLNSVGIKVEFSFDGGTTWEVIPCAIENLQGEAGIRIIEPNLADILPKSGGTIDDARPEWSTANSMIDLEVNYFTSLAKDKLYYTNPYPDEHGFVFGDWKTRVRVTACIQLDQRLRYISEPTDASGSPLRHRAIYDFSDRYTRQIRTTSSTYYSSDLSAWTTDESDKLAAHLDAVRYANEDMSINGAFELDRLWIDAEDAPTFRIGDGVKSITGREVSLYAARPTVGEPEGVYPEIAQIFYDIERQTQRLITRDLRLSPRI